MREGEEGGREGSGENTETKKVRRSAEIGRGRKGAGRGGEVLEQSSHWEAFRTLSEWKH